MSGTMGVHQYPNKCNQTLYKCLSCNDSIWSNNDNSGICEICGKPRKGAIGEAFEKIEQQIAAKDREVAAAGFGVDPPTLPDSVQDGDWDKFVGSNDLGKQRKALEALWKLVEDMDDNDSTKYYEIYDLYLNSDTLTQFITRITEADDVEN